MTATTTVEGKINSRLVCVDSIFVNQVLLRDFNHMEEILGGDCYAIALPQNILLWCSVSYGEDSYKHTMTIHHKTGKAENLYGNILITSNDEDDLNGIGNLTEPQLKWLRDNLALRESKLHGNYVLYYNA